ncbi:MAG TPA: ATP-binding protein [Candidatus Krumholzibacteria bacterium]|nr:ATP-binding protein [Candidatus Krumholzibacteria bacterium]
MKSIRASLIIGSVIGTVAVFTLSGIAIYRGARTTLVRQLDESMGDEARVIASVVKYTPEGMEVEIEDIGLPEYTSPTATASLEIWLDADSVLYRSPYLGTRDLERAPSPDLNHPVFRWIRAGDVHARAVDMRTTAMVDHEDWEEVNRPTPQGPVIHVVVAQPATDIDHFLARLRTLLIGVGALGGLLVALVLAAVVQRSLRPLDRLAREIGDLSDEDMSARVRMPAVREVAPVVEELNQLLARLEDAFEREHTFSTDIAHELRTPLAGLRSTLEVTLSRPREPDDYRATMEGLLAIVRRVQNMVETLLYLGRLDSGQVEIEHRAVDVCEVVNAAWQPLVDVARTKNVSVSLRLPGNVNVISDPVLLEVAVRNVLDNAVEYVNTGGRIQIDVTSTPGRAQLRVANSGSQIAPERVGDLLRRFTRADSSRRASGQHFGLGLALTGRIAASLGFELELASSQGGDFVVVLSARAE